MQCTKLGLVVFSVFVTLSHIPNFSLVSFDQILCGSTVNEDAQTPMVKMLFRGNFVKTLINLFNKYQSIPILNENHNGTCQTDIIIMIQGLLP